MTAFGKVRGPTVDEKKKFYVRRRLLENTSLGRSDFKPYTTVSPHPPPKKPDVIEV